MSCTGRKYADTTLIHLKYIGIEREKEVLFKTVSLLKKKRDAIFFKE